MVETTIFNLVFIFQPLVMVSDSTHIFYICLKSAYFVTICGMFFFFSFSLWLMKCKIENELPKFKRNLLFLVCRAMKKEEKKVVVWNGKKKNHQHTQSKKWEREFLFVFKTRIRHKHGQVAVYSSILCMYIATLRLENMIKHGRKWVGICNGL